MSKTARKIEVTVTEFEAGGETLYGVTLVNRDKKYDTERKVECIAAFPKKEYAAQEKAIEMATKIIEVLK